MKYAAIVVFLFTFTAKAKILEVPESCFHQKKAPCLTQFRDQGEILKLKKVSFRVLKDSIIHWKSFEDVSIDVLKGKLQMILHEPIRVNEIYLTGKNHMVERLEKSIFILDLEKFFLSTYTIHKVQSNNVLEKSVFLEKSELLQFVARFFERKIQYSQFLKTIEKPWKKEFAANTDNQTQVIKRAIASAVEAKRTQQEQKEQMTDELKRLREQFFYRTFYR